MKTLASVLLLCGVALAATDKPAPGIQLVEMPDKSPLVTFRLVFRTGSAADPQGREGLAALTAAMLAEGGTKNRTYNQILDALYPMATQVGRQVDKEMTTFYATTHVDNLEAFYGLLREMLLEPGWRADDLTRLRDDQINYLRVSLRDNNDEELGKEVLYERIYAGHPYGHVNEGHAAALKAVTMDDIRGFYAAQYRQGNLTLGLAGGYPAGFAARVAKDFAALPAGAPEAPRIAAPVAPKGLNVTLVDKATRGVAFSLGHPISVRRGDKDFAALLVAQSWLGFHRNSWGRLYQRMRHIRGLNYGDYAYIEYFPRGMFQFEPDPNLARGRQIFQIWIRPVEAPTAHFALRLAMFEFDRLVREGIPAAEVERTRNFLAKNVNLLLKTKNAELGYAIDSRFYGIPEYSGWLKAELAKLKPEDVNAAVKRHLDPRNLHIVAIGPNMEAFRTALVENRPSPMTYNAAKPDDLLAEDKLITNLNLDVRREQVKIVPVATVFE